MRKSNPAGFTIGVSFVVVLAASTAPAQRADFLRPRAVLVSQLDSLVATKLAWLPTSSIAVAVVRGGDTLLMRGYGLADRESKRSATPNTVYRIASLTKHVTAAAIMRLVEQRKLGLDDDIGRYVPGFPLQGQRVTVRHLLNHTSGIPNITSGTEWRRHWNEDVRPDSVVGWVAGQQLDFAPGSKLAYTNTGYILLGMIIERVSGRPYATYVQEELFRPLGLRQTAYCPSRTTDSLAAKGYSVRDSQFVPAAYISMTIPFAAGGVCSSVSDFAAWQRAFHEARIVGATSYRQMVTPVPLTSGPPGDYGFGLWIGRLGNRHAFMHGGGINGFASTQVYIPSDSLAVVLFANTDAFGVEGIALDLARLVVGVRPTGIGRLDPP